MAYTTIDDPSEYFQVLTYTGNAAANRALTNTGNSDLQPDMIWIQPRNNSSGYYNAVQDTSRGIDKILSTNTNAVEVDSSAQVISVQSNGFTIDDNADSQNYVNVNSLNYVAWQWKCNAGSTTSGAESGNNPAYSYQANTTAGFSIVTYTGTGAEGIYPHGLGATPTWVWTKDRDATERPAVMCEKITGVDNAQLLLDRDDAFATGSNNFNGDNIDSTNMSVVSSGNYNTDGDKYVAYLWTPIQGFSKFGIFHSDNTADGTFVYLGFKPKWIMAKNGTQQHANHDWIIFDSERETRNEIDTFLRANGVDAEVTSGRNEIDFLSNGFKARASYGDFNGGSNHEFAYYAFAEHPFVSSKGVPTTAF